MLAKIITNKTLKCLEDINNNVLAWAVDFEEDIKMCFSVIANKIQQGNGLGKALIKRLKEDLGEFYGWVYSYNDYQKENGENYQSPISFYIKQGFEVLNYIQIDNEMLKEVKIKKDDSLTVKAEPLTAVTRDLAFCLNLKMVLYLGNLCLTKKYCIFNPKLM